MLLSLSLTISIAKSCTRSMAKLLRFMSSICKFWLGETSDETSAKRCLLNHAIASVRVLQLEFSVNVVAGPSRWLDLSFPEAA
jgi:hypothetical protein